MLKKLYFAVIFRFTKWTFNFWQAIGLHVVPNHFYQPVPDTRNLSDSIWSTPSRMVGVELNVDKQLDLIKKISEKYSTEYEKFPATQNDLISGSDEYFYSHNPFIAPADSEFLYSLVRDNKPNRIVEIGSGFSTYLSAIAIHANLQEDGSNTDLIAIEPYPNETLRKGFKGLTELKTTKLQDVPLDLFENLGEGDILFIDSTHVLNIGSDVSYEFLELIPRLKSGVYVHIHDIYLPYEYPKSMIYEDMKFYTEQYILHALLVNNPRLEVIYSGYYLHLNHSNELKKAFPRYNPTSKAEPVSFWLKVK